MVLVPPFSIGGNKMKAQLIEATGKPYKVTQFCGAMLMGVGAIAAGVIMQLDTTGRGEHMAAIAGMTIVGLGAVTWLVGAALAWWYHG